MPTSSRKTSNTPAIEVHDLTVRFGTATILEDVSFHVARGGLVALLGPNGSGKTTLMRVLLGLQPTASGSVKLFGEAPRAHYGRISYVPQKFTPDRSVPMTVGEFLRVSASRHTPPHRFSESLDEVGLNPASIQHAQLTHLSGGQLQRVLIARALLNSPEILFLDEPSTGIDIAGEQTLFELLSTLNKEHNVTILMISHEVNMVARHVDQVLCLNTSLVCSGPPKSALNKDTLEELYGSDYADTHGHNHHHL